MASDGPDRTLTDEQIARSVQLVQPNWDLREARLADRGWTALYHLDVDTPAGRRQCVLKAAPDVGGHTGIDAEARIHAVVADNTSIPAPTVFGAVDDHDAVDESGAMEANGDVEPNDAPVRTPFFLMESMAGETVSMAEVGTIPDDALRRIARTTGEYLGALHTLDVGFETFGKGVDYAGEPSLQGERPPGDPAELVVSDGSDEWRAQVREWVAGDLDRLAESRFADLAPRVRAELERRVDALPEDVSPVLGRVDHAWFNLLVDREAGRLTGVIDWGSRFAVPAGFDLAVVEFLLAGGWWIALPEVPDRRQLVREALLAGYRVEATVPPTLDVQRACYQFDDLIRWMAVLEERAGGSERAIAPDRVEEAAAGYRRLVETELDRAPSLGA